MLSHVPEIGDHMQAVGYIDRNFARPTQVENTGFECSVFTIRSENLIKQLHGPTPHNGYVDIFDPPDYSKTMSENVCIHICEAVDYTKAPSKIAPIWMMRWITPTAWRQTVERRTKGCRLDRRVVLRTPSPPQVVAVGLVVKARGAHDHGLVVGHDALQASPLSI
jgi:hypothetical protein